ncbi:MAG: hypothetical protein V3T83_18190 [Acidobacteriota bacterium]
MAAKLARFAGSIQRLIRPFSSPGRVALYILLSTPAAVAAGLAAGRLWLPLLQALAFYPLFCGLLLGGRMRRALWSALGWAFWMAVLVAGLSYALPEYCQQRILNGEAYQAEMFDWIRTGSGAEGDIRLFLPQHLMHLAAFFLLTLLSAGFLSLALGSVLMNYMAFYVGTLLLQGTAGLPLLLIAWPPWAALRVIAFILLATGLSAWGLKRLKLGQAGRQQVRPYLAAGLALIGADILLKWLLAPYWREWLHGLTHWP